MGQGLNGALNNGSIPCFNNNSLVHIMGQGVSGPLNSDLMTDILNQCERPYILSPFVQYASIGIVERRINK